MLLTLCGSPGARAGLWVLGRALTTMVSPTACIPDVLELSKNWRGCTASHGWLEMLTEQLPSLFSPAPILVNVGANKGYEAPRFLSLWSQRKSVSAKTWLRGIRDVAEGKASVNGEAPRRNGFLASQTCGACKEACMDGSKPHARDGGSVHLLEMAPPNAKLLRYLANVTNSSDLVSVHNVAVSNENGTAHTQANLLLGWENAGMLPPKDLHVAKKRASCQKRASCPPAVDKLTVDDFLARERLPQIVDLIVIDTEGHDPYVLDGMRGALASKRITLLEFEYSGKWPAERSLGHTLTSLAAHGYKCYMESRSHSRRGDEMLAPLSPPCWDPALERRKWSNVVCSHEPRALAMLDAAAWATFEERKSNGTWHGNNQGARKVWRF